MMKKIGLIILFVVFFLLATLIVLIVRSWPDIKRYERIREM